MVAILETTLREGEQTPGVYFDTHIKSAIANLLNEIGVDYIEVGHPAVDPDVKDAVTKIARHKHQAKICAHSRSLQHDVDAALECGVDFLGIFYCVSNKRLEGVFKKDLDTAIEQISSIIRYAKEQNPELMIRYTPEDTVRSELANVVKTAAAAVHAGADVISIADTTGHMIPGTDRNMYDYVTNLRAALKEEGAEPLIAVHLHNDRGCAVANALDAFRAGADIIDTTVLGIGERAGIVDLATILTVLKQDFNVENEWQLAKLQELYALVSKHAMAIPPNAPVMGANAFTHCAGVHTQAAVQNRLHYQSLDPRPVGREMNICLDHMSGLASMQYALEQVGADRDLAPALLPRVKAIGKKGRVVEFDELKHLVEEAEKAPCVLVFGGVGVGKTTLVTALAAKLRGEVLDRRALVTAHVLPHYKQETGINAESREERVVATQWFLQNNPGLGRIVRQHVAGNPETLYVGDVLRDKEEIEYVLQNMRNAIIIALDAPQDVRAQRVVGRNDAFDDVQEEARGMEIIKLDEEKHNIADSLAFLAGNAHVLTINTAVVNADGCVQQALDFIER